MIPGLSTLDLLFRLVLVAMEGQTPEQRKQIWDWFIQDVTWWRKALGIEDAKPPAQ